MSETIEEIREAKKVLESDILELINNFSKDHGLYITGLDVDTVGGRDIGGGLYYVNRGLTVNLEDL